MGTGVGRKRMVPPGRPAGENEKGPGRDTKGTREKTDASPGPVERTEYKEEIEKEKRREESRSGTRKRRNQLFTGLTYMQKSVVQREG